jgi:hypothetical protein
MVRNLKKQVLRQQQFIYLEENIPHFIEVLLQILPTYYF